MTVIGILPHKTATVAVEVSILELTHLLAIQNYGHIVTAILSHLMQMTDLIKLVFNMLIQMRIYAFYRIILVMVIIYLVAGIQRMMVPETHIKMKLN